MKDTACFIYSDQYLRYHFGNGHPFNNKRLELTLDLIRSFDIGHPHFLRPPRIASDEELNRIHDLGYIETVKGADSGNIPRERLEAYGLGTGDNPLFPGIHEAASLIAGGTLEAVDGVMKRRFDHALNLAGGLHHALRGKASGFCIYNDASVAIAHLREKYDARVLYIDTDAHHGDGVQWSFYHDPDVCTLSIHETGRYLFPGTGHLYERGGQAGWGTSINIPLDAFTEDDSWLDAFRRVVPQVARSFQPDIILSQHGCDAHRWDPMTHLSTTMMIYREIPRLIHEWAHQLCDGRWVALGGGGYDIWRVVPRAWTYLWAEMAGIVLENKGIPYAWRDRWQGESPVPLPLTLDDPEDLFPPIPRRKEITRTNEATVQQILRFYNLNHC
ncbi:MAG: acetoin utilization protein AcuC [Firmicutes bacterium]|uniref:Acetoin utilization protein AcuC n=1 Tax=Melghirimyces thermohalophilus TaxID=1236220 RepID=A0A1G6KXA0_9BACL|nr:acetoin utilization protein AcuC [Melghirimyces thermohalophilus]MDA8353307.1 acetoin utilization protein AcuC [Bacillota bacterium]SDC35085.1 acetoin utilization protein AcuC [Melghirimyces thermohalophilus]